MALKPDLQNKNQALKYIRYSLIPIDFFNTSINFVFSVDWLQEDVAQRLFKVSSSIFIIV